MLKDNSQGAMNWRKAKASGGQFQDQCVEAGVFPDTAVAVRDTKHSKVGPVLAFAPSSWGNMIKAMK